MALLELAFFILPLSLITFLSGVRLFTCLSNAAEEAEEGVVGVAVGVAEPAEEEEVEVSLERADSGGGGGVGCARDLLSATLSMAEEEPWETVLMGSGSDDGRSVAADIL